jgi:Ca2+-binding EF-hand superfamily protein
MAFQRLDRDGDGKINSHELLNFLRDNGVEDATEADTHYLVKYYSSDGKGRRTLDFDDLLQLIMPCDDQILRTTLAQRPIFAISEFDLLSEDTERELTRLFEK